MAGVPHGMIGEVLERPRLIVQDRSDLADPRIDADIHELKEAWQAAAEVVNRLAMQERAWPRTNTDGHGNNP
jgi:hypothetical protein